MTDRLVVGGAGAATVGSTVASGEDPAGATTSTAASAVPGTDASGAAADLVRPELRAVFADGIVTISGPRPPTDAEAALVDPLRGELGVDRVAVAWSGTASGVVDTALYGRIASVLLALARTDPIGGALDVRDGIAELTATVPTERDRDDLIAALAQAMGGADRVRPIITVGTRPGGLPAPSTTVAGPATVVAATTTVAPTTAPATTSTTSTSTTVATTTTAPSGPPSSVALDDAQVLLQQRLDALLASRRVSFQTNLAILDRQGLGTVDALADLLRGSGVRVEIAGHTDNRGDEDKNVVLSRQRAEAVVAALVARGIPQGELVAVGYGSAQPVASNATRDGQARNRRIAVRILGPA